MSARRMQFLCSFALNCLQCWCHKNSCSWLRTFFKHYYCFVKLSCVPMHMRIFHNKKLLSSVLPFNTTVFPWNASCPVCINSCTSYLDSVISIAFFFIICFWTDGAKCYVVTQKIENSAFKKNIIKCKCKVRLDKHILFL